MKIKRNMTHIDALDSASQLLVALQVGGHLDGVELPNWATGTSVEELFKAVRYIGDAEWLDGVYEGYGPQESADRWLEDFLKGTPVPDMQLAQEIIANPEELDDDDDDDDEPGLNKALDEFIENLPNDAATRFKKRLEQEEGFYASVNQNMTSISLAVAASIGANEEEFNATQAEFTFLSPDAASDTDLAAMSKYYLIDNYEYFLGAIGVDDTMRSKAIKRIKTLGVKLKKAMKSAA